MTMADDDRTPVPIPTPTSAPFWDALQHDEIRIQRCDRCQTWIYYPRSHCPSCLAPEPGWLAIAGTGVIHSFTIARQAPAPMFDDDTPLVLAIVALDEGPRLTTNIVHTEGEDLAVGQRVVPVFDRIDDDHVLLRYRRP
jgi:uncharacterized OB-fold protein